MGERLSLEKTVFMFRYWFDMNSVQGLQRRMVLVDSFSNFLNYHFVALFWSSAQFEGCISSSLIANSI